MAIEILQICAGNMIFRCQRSRSLVRPAWERVIFKRTNPYEKATRKAQGFHTDFKGPFSTPAHNGVFYLLTIIDDFSRRIFSFLVKSTSEWLGIWMAFVKRVEAEIGQQGCIAWLVSDNGAVYRSPNFAEPKAFSRSFQPLTLNGKMELRKETCGQLAKWCLHMIHSNLPKRAWGWAARLACEVINRNPESAVSNKRTATPETWSRLERWYGRALPGQTRALNPLGCLCFNIFPPNFETKCRCTQLRWFT